MRVIKPTDQALSGLDLKSVTTHVSSEIFPAGKHFQFVASLKVVGVGATTLGLANWVVDVFEDAGGTITIHSIPAVTAINLKVVGTSYSVFTFGGTGADIYNGSLASGAGALRIAPFVRVSLDVTEASDAATSSTGSVYLLAERFGGG